MPQFVIQEHSHNENPTHWDLMLQDGDTLLSWRIEFPPGEIPSSPITAVKIFDHPVKFLTYQGPVNNNRGKVKIAEQGRYSLNEKSQDLIVIAVIGQILNGTIRLTRQHNDAWKLLYANHV